MAGQLNRNDFNDFRQFLRPATVSRSSAACIWQAKKPKLGGGPNLSANSPTICQYVTGYALSLDHLL
jgi:hypothetical protein